MEQQFPAQMHRSHRTASHFPFRHLPLFLSERPQFRLNPDPSKRMPTSHQFKRPFTNTPSPKPHPVRDSPNSWPAERLTKRRLLPPIPGAPKPNGASPDLQQAPHSSTSPSPPPKRPHQHQKLQPYTTKLPLRQHPVLGPCAYPCSSVSIRG